MQWMMLQQDEPEDFATVTGQQISVGEFVELAARELGWNKKNNQNAIKWKARS